MTELEEFTSRVLTKIRELDDQMLHALKSGMAPDFPTYREMVGKYTTYAQCFDIVNEEYKKYQEEKTGKVIT